MTTHYEALEVSEQASAADIRRAYRRLVLLTHPDRTQDPAAHERYLTVNRAYDVLSLPDKRKAYDARLWALRNPPPPLVPRPVVFPHPDPAYRGPWPPPVVPRRPARDPYAAQYARYTPAARVVCRILVAFSLLLVLDSQWVLTLLQEPVVSQKYHISYSRRGGVLDSYYLTETPRASFRGQIPYKQGEVLTLTRTAIFRQVLTHRPASAPVQETINSREETLYNYGPILCFPFIMWVAAAVGIWPGSVRRRAVDAAVTAFLFALITSFFLLRT
ncbi:heat shock protein DnaJ domain protein [Hymenobacter roseosalivarius DSM 11622]|uniref:Heat shock protein DnaJ domain protein n=1 Tax=Hymenobacter roseosalivarius DSM 11622 TaxID=645990 RepID=A0A1W1VR08_9BACT|nr:J domain-containing protein [Hymenobacter roseosalivarius]SMB95660.1 heat shock protein DnaJ domain protein [Hymenobacter roseosalivarius DSM 11622]